MAATVNDIQGTAPSLSSACKTSLGWCDAQLLKHFSLNYWSCHKKTHMFFTPLSAHRVMLGIRRKGNFQKNSCQFLTAIFCFIANTLTYMNCVVFFISQLLPRWQCYWPWPPRQLSNWPKWQCSHWQWDCYCIKWQCSPKQLCCCS